VSLWQTGSGGGGHNEGGKPITKVAVLPVKVTLVPNAVLTSSLPDALVTQDMREKAITLPGMNVALPETAKSYQNTPPPGELGSTTIDAELHRAEDAKPRNAITAAKAAVPDIPFSICSPQLAGVGVCIFGGADRKMLTT